MNICIIFGSKFPFAFELFTALPTSSLCRQQEILWSNRNIQRNAWTSVLAKTTQAWSCQLKIIKRGAHSTEIIDHYDVSTSIKRPDVALWTRV